MNEYRIDVTLMGGTVVTLENLDKGQCETAMKALKHSGPGYTSLDRPGGKTVHIRRDHIVVIVEQMQ